MAERMEERLFVWRLQIASHLEIVVRERDDMVLPRELIIVCKLPDFPIIVAGR